jgi:hypothetical protein
MINLKAPKELKAMDRQQLYSYFREVHDIYTYTDLDLQTWLTVSKYLKKLESKYLQGRLSYV